MDRRGTNKLLDLDGEVTMVMLTSHCVMRRKVEKCSYHFTTPAMIADLPFSLPMTSSCVIWQFGSLILVSLTEFSGVNDITEFIKLLC